jgi:hypothetical protein
MNPASGGCLLRVVLDTNMYISTFTYPVPILNDHYCRFGSTLLQDGSRIIRRNLFKEFPSFRERIGGFGSPATGTRPWLPPGFCSGDLKRLPVAAQRPARETLRDSQGHLSSILVPPITGKGMVGS